MTAVYIDTNPRQVDLPPTLTDPIVHKLLSCINTARARQGLQAYTILDRLVASARLHNQVMASGCGLLHQCPGEPNFAMRISAHGVPWTRAGENIGSGGPVPGTQTALLASQLLDDMLAEVPPNDGHRRNLLSSDLEYVGIDVYRDADGMVWMTQDFTG